MTFYSVLFLLSFGLTVFGVKYVAAFLIRKQILDLPNHRSSHTIPTPRGGGLAMMPVLIGLWGVMAWLLPESNERMLTLVVCGLAIFLSGVSWLDDYRPDGLSARLRLLAHAMAVIIPLLLMPNTIRLFGEILPLWAERLIMGLGWMWYINLFNFMDGINGISGQQGATNAVAIGLISFLSIQQISIPFYSLVMVGCCLGFLVWNARSKALIFLGDIGSTGLGYLLGWLFILFALHGFVLPVIVVSLYYLTDATYTLIKRFLKGAAVWTPHREHFYQQAVDSGQYTHTEVSGIVAVLNIILAGLAYLLTLEWEWVYQAVVVASALACVTIACWMFTRAGKR